MPTVSPPSAVSKQVYNPCVRVGNWCEDELQHRSRMDEFLTAHSAGTLSSLKISSCVAHFRQTVSLSKSVSYNTLLMLQHAYTYGFLCVDGSSSLNHSNGSTEENANKVFNLTLSLKEQKSVLRNSFRFVKVEDYVGTKAVDPNFNGPICYGDRVLICFDLLNKDGRKTVYYLHSEPKSVMSYAKLSRNQQVFLTTEKSTNCHWRIISADKTLRMEKEGFKVVPGDRIMITHCLTNNDLMSDPQHLVRNDFDAEYEVSCRKLLSAQYAEKPHSHFLFWVDTHENVAELGETEQEEWKDRMGRWAP